MDAVSGSSNSGSGSWEDEDALPRGSNHSNKGEVRRDPSFVFKSVKDKDLENAAQSTSKNGVPSSSASHSPASTPKAPSVGERKEQPPLLEEFSDHSEDEWEDDNTVGGKKDEPASDAKSSTSRGKNQRPRSTLYNLDSEEFGKLRQVAEAAFGEDDSRGVKDDEEETSGRDSINKLEKNAAKPLPPSNSKSISKREHDVLDEILEEFEKEKTSKNKKPPAEPPVPKTPNVEKPDAGATAVPSASPKKTQVAAATSVDSSSSSSSTPHSTTTPSTTSQVNTQPASASKNGPRLDPFTSMSGKKPRVDKKAASDNRGEGEAINAAALSATPIPSSSTTSPSSAPSPKQGTSTPSRIKKTEVTIDGKQPPEPEKRTKLKKSPRSERPERAKRRSQRMAALTLQPRYVPDTGDRDVPASSQASLEQCRGLLQLLEAGCDKGLRWQLLGALVEMAFALPKKSRAEVLERSWRCARALPDAQLRQWAHQVLSRYYKAKGSDDDDSSEESSETSFDQSMQDFTALCREVKGATAKKAWNELAAKIAGSKLGVQAQLEATAVAIDSFKGMKDKAAIRDAMFALKKKLGAKLLVIAFFRSSACPGAKRLRWEIQHTASAVLRGILAGAPEAIKDFENLLNSEFIADGIEEALHGCMKELATDLMPRQPGNASPAPANTGEVRSATATSNAPTDATTATPQPVSAPETILDIVRELLLLEGQSDVPGATWLPDRSICLLISVLELEHDAALRAIDDVAYDNAVSFIHGVCASTLTPLSCKMLIEDMVPDEDNKPTLPLLQHLMISGNIHVARQYLGKLDASDMRKSDLNRLLNRIDGSGPSAMELAIILGRDDNIREFIDIVAGLGKLGADEKLALLEAKRNDGTPGLLGAIQSDSTKMEASVYAYMTGLLQFDKKHIRDVIGMLSAPNKDGNSPFRLALMKDDASLVYSMVRAICEDETLAPDEKAALLSGQTSVADVNVDYREKGLTAYYLAVKAMYLKKFPNDSIPKSKAADNGKITYFTSTTVSFEKPFDRVDANAKLQWDKARDESLFAMMSRFTESERKECKQLGQRLVRQEREKATSAFHAALRNGKAQSVTGYIRATIEYAVPGSHIRPISLILAEDASGNPALCNAMENDEFRAVGAYVEAVLSSDLQIEDKYALLKPYGEDGYTPLQIAMASGSRRAMSAYVASVLASSLSDDQKQELLLSTGKNGKSARQMLDDLLQRKPTMDRASLQQFDAMITESDLGGPIKRFLIHDYGDKGGVKKT